jgi:drug/metabolite transporter (DMT)-like permease
MVSSTAFYVIGLLVFGSLNTLTTKIQFSMQSEGIDGLIKNFQKPWFGTFSMFAGMVLVLLVHFIAVVLSRRSRKGAVSVAESKQPSFWRASLLILIPATLDLVATALCFIGLLYNSASIWQMLRGSMVIFSAIMSVLYLKRRMQAFHWFGVMTCVVAICTVGFANIMATASEVKTASAVPTSLVAFGMVMIVLGQVIQASQVVVEEKLLKGYSIAPFQIVGMEGVWGTLLMILICFPIAYLVPGADAGSIENSFDTVVMLENSHSLTMMIWLYIFSVFTYNISGMMVTYALSAVHRTMLEASRTAVIWAFDLFVHYYVSADSPYGEKWVPTWSMVQLFGFFLLVIGQSIYAEIIKLPWLFNYGTLSQSPIILSMDTANKRSMIVSPASVKYNVLIPPSMYDVEEEEKHDSPSVGEYYFHYVDESEKDNKKVENEGTRKKGA